MASKKRKRRERFTTTWDARTESAVRDIAARRGWTMARVLEEAVALLATRERAA